MADDSGSVEPVADEVRRKIREMEEQQKLRQLEEQENAFREKQRASKKQQGLWHKTKKHANTYVGDPYRNIKGATKEYHTPVFIAILIAFHLIDGIVFRFGTDPSHFMTRIAFYLLMFLWVTLVFRKDISLGAAGAAAVIEIGFPLILAFVNGFGIANDRIFNIIVALWLVTPAMALFVATHTQEIWLTSFWKGAMIITVVFLVLSQGIFPMFVPGLSNSLDVVGALQDTSDAVEDGAYNLWDALTAGFTGFRGQLDNALNYATGGYYKGMVEDTQDEPIGIRITNFRAIEDFYFTDQSIYLWADIEGKSFKDTVKAVHSCIIEKVPGVTTQVIPDSTEVFAQTYDSIQCYIAPDTLPAGRHNVEFRSKFNFETWSYVTYTFVRQETMLSFLAQDKDINRNLDIDRMLKPIYTPGPVSMGMSADVTQPVGVHADYKLNSVFGVKLDNYWTDGDLDFVNYFVLLYPEEFSLQNCDVDDDRLEEVDPNEYCGEGSDGCGAGMKALKINKRELKPTTSSSVQCKLILDASVDELVPIGQQKVQKTFAAIANYNYLLKKRKRIEVKEILIPEEGGDE